MDAVAARGSGRDSTRKRGGIGLDAGRSKRANHLSPNFSFRSSLRRFARNRTLPWFALGAEGAGEVVSLGPGVAGLAVGQPVTFVGGAFAEYVVARAALCWPVAAATPEAVALTISGTVAATALLVRPRHL